MTRPIIGWERADSIPDGTKFTDYLHVQNGDLYLDQVNLGELLRSHQYTSPLEIVYLPLIRRQITKLQDHFAEAIKKTDYQGRFIFAYASKANAAEEVVRTVLQTSADYEMSSMVDVQIAALMKSKGFLNDEKMVICNGFKAPGTGYMREIISFRRQHERIIPIIEDPIEVAPLADSGLTFDVGVRQKTYGSARDLAGLDTINSRFGMDRAGLEKAVQHIEAAPNLTLKILHAMVGSQILDVDTFVERLTPSIELFAQLRKRYPSLSIFNFGGGIPVEMTLDFTFDYQLFAVKLMRVCQEACGRHGVPVPDIMGEMGRYTVTEHGMHLFKITTAKDNGSTYPWLIIDGSIMSSFPDSWALGELFTVLPLNQLDRPFHQVQLGGVTCDSDDVYPRNPAENPLFLPIPSDEEQFIGFFSVGAYQEMLGGAGGSKHCVIPEADELIIDLDENGNLVFELLQGQNSAEVISNLGYGRHL
ncbi:MAG: hypothetical protein QNJ45_22335 [Ardenticatenaceae bacterium]|nr:hypothetical protein [Ardenticatenaceae bacterium]